MKYLRTRTFELDISFRLKLWFLCISNQLANELMCDFRYFNCFGQGEFVLSRHDTYPVEVITHTSAAVIFSYFTENKLQYVSGIQLICLYKCMRLRKKGWNEK